MGGCLELWRVAPWVAHSMFYPAWVSFLLNFYGLASHMYQALGGWPESIGNNGFPDLLNRHARVTGMWFGCYILVECILWPLVITIAGIVEKFRNGLPYIVAAGISFWIFMPFIFAAPDKFLYWWWD